MFFSCRTIFSTSYVSLASSTSPTSASSISIASFSFWHSLRLAATSTSHDQKPLSRSTDSTAPASSQPFLSTLSVSVPAVSFFDARASYETCGCEMWFFEAPCCRVRLLKSPSSCADVDG